MQAAASMKGQDAFKERLKRIEKRGANTTGKVYVGEGGSVAPTRAAEAMRKNVVKVKPRKRVGLMARLMGLLFAIVLGLAAVGLVRYALFRLIGVVSPLENPTQWLGYEGGGAFGVALLLAIIIGTYKPRHILGLTLGVAAGLTLLHNAVHMRPDLFAMAFSPEWVQMVIDTSMPRSAVLLDKMVLF